MSLKCASDANGHTSPSETAQANGITYSNGTTHSTGNTQSNGTTTNGIPRGAHKSALVTGADGQDGSYLCELLLSKGYTVHGLVRHHSEVHSKKSIRRLDNPAVQYHYGDVLDPFCLIKVLRIAAPDEVYHLAAQSHVGLSFSMSSYTTDVDALGTLRLLEAIFALGMDQTVRFYNASSSEVYGDVKEQVQNENTPFNPQSPYAVAKLYSYYTTVNFRNRGMYAVNGILFNHESPRRGLDFVTRKISRAVALIHLGEPHQLQLGNLNAFRDWGHSRDYVRGMWMMMQQPKASDFVLATGQTHSVREFVEEAFRVVDIIIEWRGSATCEVGIDDQNQRTLVRVDPALYRPLDVGYLLGSATKAKQQLGWSPETTFQELVREMVMADVEALKEGNSLKTMDGQL